MVWDRENLPRRPGPAQQGKTRLGSARLRSARLGPAMVERSDEAPLLFWAEGPAVSAPPPAAEPGSSGSGGRRLGGGWSAAPWDGEGPAEAAGPPRAEAEEDQIVAVFVVTFDPRTGNMVEWCLPQDIDLEGVEFKSMASGSHKIQSDFM